MRDCCLYLPGYSVAVAVVDSGAQETLQIVGRGAHERSSNGVWTDTYDHYFPIGGAEGPRGNGGAFPRVMGLFDVSAAVWNAIGEAGEKVRDSASVFATNPTESSIAELRNLSIGESLDKLPVFGRPRRVTFRRTATLDAISGLQTELADQMRARGGAAIRGPQIGEPIFIIDPNAQNIVESTAAGKARSGLPAGFVGVAAGRWSSHQCREWWALSDPSAFMGKREPNRLFALLIPAKPHEAHAATNLTTAHAELLEGTF